MPRAARPARDAARAAPRARPAAEERLQIHIRLLGDAELQQRLLGVAERACDQQVGELLDAHVVHIDRLVVPLAAVGDGVLERGDAALQLHEVLVGAQLGVGLGDREELPQAAAAAESAAAVAALFDAVREGDKVVVYAG